MVDKKEYQPLKIPRVMWSKDTLTAMQGELIAQPLEAGFGLTLGNALRRVLLGGVEGAAVTSVIIQGVNNEFSPLPGVIEDTMQLLLNIKQLVVKSKDGKPGTMRLRVQGEAAVTAADIEADSNIVVVNKEHVLGHVSEDGILDIEFFVNSGRGYQAAQWPMSSGLQPDGRIYLDAMFSPIRKVTFDVEKTRVGGEIDYDKLILTVHTDGSENPVDVVNYAVSVLRTQLEHFLTATEIPFNSMVKTEVQEIPETLVDQTTATIKNVSIDLLLKPIDELELSVRAHNCLINAGIKRILDLVNLTEDDGLKIKNFGRKSLDEVKESMKAFGLSFGMDIKESDIKKIMKEQ